MKGKLLPSPEQLAKEEAERKAKEDMLLEEQHGHRKSPTRAQKRAACRRLYGKAKLW